jgi:ankyrin repeat protein
VHRCPEVVTKRNNEGDLPLHLACKNQEPLKTIQFLIQKLPESVEMPDGNGYLPFHIAGFSDGPLDVIFYLTEMTCPYLDSIISRESSNA